MEEEIKYLINKLPSNLSNPLYIEQYYFVNLNYDEYFKNYFPTIDLTKINTFRLRKIKFNNNTSYILTLKGSGTYKRLEYECQISKEEFILFKTKTISLIIKNRYIYQYEELKFEFDEYLNLDQIMYTCEIEKENILNEKKRIEEIFTNFFKIDYLDVSLDLRYRNSNLLKYFKKEQKNDL